MTFITWTCLRCVQELATISGPQNPTQRSCDKYFIVVANISDFLVLCFVFCSFNFIYFFSELGTSCVDTSKQNLLVEKTFTVKIQNKEQNPKSLRLKTLLTFAKDSSLHFMKSLLHGTIVT